LAHRPGLDELEGRQLMSGYTPAQIKHAYGFDTVTFRDAFSIRPKSVAGDGSGETIAIVDPGFDPDIYGDVDQFDKLYAVSQYNSSTLYNAYGTAGTYQNEKWLSTFVENSQGKVYLGSGWTGSVSIVSQDCGEIAADVEWAHAVAPGAKILLVEAYDTGTWNNTFSNLLNMVATATEQRGVGVVSMSWGDAEQSNESSFDSVFTSRNGQGIAFVAAIGDTPGPTPNVHYPAVSPNVLAVGGTSLHLNSNNSYNYELDWYNGTASPVAGGVSAYEPTPSYQVNLGYQGRAVPDVAYDADPNFGFETYSTPQGGLYVGGGTSYGAPQWAALIAIADQGRAVEGFGDSMDGATQLLPAIYQSLPRSDFHVVGGGYNTQTGWGTPNAQLLINGLIPNGYPILPIQPILAVTPFAEPFVESGSGGQGSAGASAASSLGTAQSLAVSSSAASSVNSTSSGSKNSFDAALSSVSDDYVVAPSGIMSLSNVVFDGTALGKKNSISLTS
jgi:subtilase family serine protease